MNKTTEVATLLTTQKVAQEFVIIANELDKFDNISQNLTITDDETLAVAENNAAQIKTLLTRTEATRKALGDDYYATWKMINDYAKTISVRLEAFKQRIALAVTSWRAVQEAAAREELRKKEERLREEEKLKQDEAARLVRLTNTVFAKLYGGTYQTKNGEQIASGCHTKEDCDRLDQAIFKSFPKAEEFKYFPERRDEIYNTAMKAVRNHKVDLMELNSTTSGIRDAAEARIKKNRMDAGLAVQKTDEQLNKKISQEIKKEIKEGEKEIQEAAKGTRKILKFRIVNEEEVTREFLSVDEVKIRNWMEGQNADIKSQLQKGLQPIKGVEFYVETTHVSRQ